MNNPFRLTSLKNSLFVLLAIFLFSCEEKSLPTAHPQIKVLDPNLQMEMILEDPEIMTPVGMTIDDTDALYVMESHTHSPMSDYPGPKFDRIKKGTDTDGDGTPDQWTVFADSLEDGMNLEFRKGHGLFVVTKDALHLLKDTDGDGISDKNKRLLHLYEPQNLYDHSALLGLAIADDWIYVSRGNVGGNLWKVRGTDSKEISGYGDGGSVMRCKLDGSQLEPVATGFWNPFDIKFLRNGRLFLADNDPDSRGPNRLIEVVPGGSYGYQAMYGGSGNHPYLAWNGEMPGTLPYASPLGEAPCALIDASYTNFGFGEGVLVNIWEENNIVKINLREHGSTLVGSPELLVQGDSMFHPVAFVANSKGDLFISDWVVRQYPNHGKGRIWKLSRKDGKTAHASKREVIPMDRFRPQAINTANFEAVLTSGDDFEKTIARFHAGYQMKPEEVVAFLNSTVSAVRLQALLVCFQQGISIEKNTLAVLISDESPEVSQISMVYIGKNRREDLKTELEEALVQGKIKAGLFEVFLATIKQLQPEFIRQYGQLKKSKDLPRELPEGYLSSILANKNIDEAIRAIALAYLDNKDKKIPLLVSTLQLAQTEQLKSATIKALSGIRSPELAELLLNIAENPNNSEMIRAEAILELRKQNGDFCEKIKTLSSSEQEGIRYAQVKYLMRCISDTALIAQINPYFEEPKQKNTAASVWAFITGKYQQPNTTEEWRNAVNGQGNPLVGKLVFETAACANCHKIDGWGGAFGPGLSNIGKSKNEAQLISAILEPSKEIAPEWQGWYIIDKEGIKHQGRQIDVHLKKVELMNTDGSFTTYESPQSYGVSEKSLMPDNLQNLMTREELNDLIAYLTTLQ